MELIKRTIKQALTTGKTETTTGNSYVIIPDDNVIYNLQVLLKGTSLDLGFFDAADELSADEYYGYGSGGSFTPIGSFNLEQPNITITGVSNSRLNELRKYTVNGTFFDKHKTSFGPSNDGVDPNNSDLIDDIGSVQYYIGGITYVDVITENETTTTFSFQGLGYTSPDFINSPIIKDPNKSNLVNIPKTDNDVFIDRQEITAFDKNYKLEYMRNLSDLTTYASGRFFNIVKNT
jgi:hypothetical protein